MPSPAEVPPPPNTEFDPLAFWIQHKTKIQILAALLVLGLLASAIYQFTQKRAREAAQRDFAAAKTSDDYRKVIAAHPRSVVAGNAQLLLADALRGEGQADKAVDGLNTFIENQPEHPLISGAWTSLGYSQEALGKDDVALTTFQKVAATYPTSFSAPVALMAQARIHKARGDVDQAKRLFEQVISQFGQSDFAREALMETQKLKSPEPTTAVATAPAVTPEIKSAAPVVDPVPAPAPAPPAPAPPAPEATPIKPTEPAAPPATPAPAPNAAPAESPQPVEAKPQDPPPPAPPAQP